MAKRFLNTELHNDPWYMELEPKFKALWHHILEECNHAGIWKVNLKSAAFFVKAKFNSSECKEVLKGHIIEINNGKYWFIPGFINFQYGKELNPNNNVHKSVIQLLKEFKITEKTKELASPCQGAKDKEKEKEKVKAKALNTPVNLKRIGNAKGKPEPRKKAVTKTKVNPKGASTSDSQHENKSTRPPKRQEPVHTATQSESQHPLQVWINENAPQVASMEKPLTAAECTRLCAEFSEEKLKGKLLEMENYQILLKKYISANLTLRNWLKLEQERKAERNTGRKYTPPADTRTTFKYLQPGELSRKKTVLQPKPLGGMNAGIL